MRDRRAAHVRPLPPSGDRLRSRQITAASAPPRDLLRRYKPGRSSRQVPPPLSLGVIALFLILGVVMLVVGGNLLVNIAGQVASAFDNAMTRVASMAPATPAPSGVALDTPVLNAPPNDGYTNQTVVSLSGTVPGDAIGQNGYTVRAYAVAANGSRIKVAEVNVGGTSRFDTPAVSLIEGPNSFVATLVTPGGEGQPSIGTQLPEGLPCLKDSPRRSSHYIGIRQKTQQTHLGYPAEGDGSIGLRGEPFARRHVVNVALGRERDPYVDVRQRNDHLTVVRPHPCP